MAAMTNVHKTEPQADLPDDQPASQDIDDFIYLISHDVRASVRALLELPQWIAEDLEASGVRIDGQVGKSIDLMNRHTQRLDRMLVDLLAYSRVGRMQTTAPQQLDAMLATVLDQIRIPPAFKVVHHFETPTVTMGDRDLPTALHSLISNAIKHHDRPAGQIIVTSARDGAGTLLTVSDDGPGIEPDMHARVFGAMTTLRPRDEVEGSGMGLATTRKIAQFYGGSAALKPSPYGRGLSVVIRIPDQPV